MTLDEDICYQALRSRDRRFDGRFFTGVRSTGIYCRPVCPARTPLKKNVRFFACAAAAEDAGFRPCMRCRPETAPGTPAWEGSSATVSRAVRLISQGYLDDAHVDDLAAVLGVGARHLRRLFDEHLGASPNAVALTRRVHFARTLIDETDLAITEVAYSAGFSSVRRFNDAFQKVFHRNPSQVRGSTRRRVIAGATLRLRLPFRPPLNWDAILGFLRERALDGVEVVTDSYRRNVSLDGVSGVIDVAHDAGNCLVLTASAGMSRVLPKVVERVRRIFDLAADPERIASHLSFDSRLAPLVAGNPGLRIPGAWDGFEVAVRAIVGQQVSVAGARTVVGRIVRRYGEAFDGDSEIGYLFPTAEKMSRARLNGVGVTGARAYAIRGVARAVRDGEVDFQRLVALDDTIEMLRKLDGVGPWTAHYMAMRAFGDPDAFPAGDLGLMRAAQDLLGTVSEKDLLKRAERWRPWRAYAALYLWTHYAAMKETSQ